MTLEPRIHKQRGDFSHNYTPIRIKCPECMRTIKGSNHVTAYKNMPGLWRHIKREHGDISNLEFNTNGIREVLRHIALAIEWKMIADMPANNTATSLSILYDDKEPRIDVRHRLEKIAEIMRLQSEVYPVFTKNNIFAYMKIVLGKADKRTWEKYFDCITRYSTVNWENGTYEVSSFCDGI